MTNDLIMNPDDIASFAYRGTKGAAWLNLGAPINNSMTAAEMQKAAGADFEVAKANTFANFTDSQGISRAIPTGRQALLRMDTGEVLTEVGKGWSPVQNEDAFAFFQDFVSKGPLSMEAAGNLKEGRIVWALANIRDGVTILDGDEIKSYLLFSNPHRYGQTVDIKLVIERVECNNSLIVPLQGRAGKPLIQINHRLMISEEKVAAILTLAHEHLEKFKQAAEYLASRKYTADVLDTFMGEIFGRTPDTRELTRTANQALLLIETQPGAHYAPGSMWNMFNAVTFMTDHVQGRAAETRFESAFFGGNAKRKNTALELALDMASKLPFQEPRIEPPPANPSKKSGGKA